jgi:hypothetical protein
VAITYSVQKTINCTRENGKAAGRQRFIVNINMMPRDARLLETTLFRIRDIVHSVELENRLNDEKVRKFLTVAGELFPGAITLSEKNCFHWSMRLLCGYNL